MGRDNAYRRKISADWEKRGLCRNCGARPPVAERKLCAGCLDNAADNTRRYREKNPAKDKEARDAKRQAGLCRCGKPAEGKYCCRDCATTETQRAIRLKFEAIQRYGGECACCQERNIAFLTIDHVNNDGNARRKHGEAAGTKLYRRILRAETLDPTLQALCWNCNMGKRITGRCPHEDSRFFEEAAARPRYARRQETLTRQELLPGL